MDDGLDQYYEDILQYDLLTAKEEKELTRKIRLGTPAESKAARDKMITSNLRLVVWIVKKYQGQGLSLPDLIQEGTIGLIKAVESFDETRGLRFSTHAQHWIRQTTTRALTNTSRMIRLPGHLVEKQQKIGVIESQMLEQSISDPSHEDLAARSDIPLKDIQKVKGASKVTASLNVNIGDTDDLTLEDTLECETAAEAFKELIDRETYQIIDEIMECLTEEQQQMICLRYGIWGSKPQTYEQISFLLGRARETLRKQEKAALEILREELEKRGMEW